MLLCVYMPYECLDNEGSYLENLGTLKTIIDELDCTCISVVGDWNSDISDSASLFGNHVIYYLVKHISLAVRLLTIVKPGIPPLG